MLKPRIGQRIDFDEAGISCCSYSSSFLPQRQRSECEDFNAHRFDSGRESRSLSARPPAARNASFFASWEIDELDRPVTMTILGFVTVSLSCPSDTHLHVPMFFFSVIVFVTVGSTNSRVRGSSSTGDTARDRELVRTRSQRFEHRIASSNRRIW